MTKKTRMGEWGFFRYFKDGEGILMGLFQTPEMEETSLNRLGLLPLPEGVVVQFGLG